MRSRFLTITLLVATMLALVPTAALADVDVRINAIVGKVYDQGASSTDALRYVGNPPPASSYSHDYQWGQPLIETASPETSPVVLKGNIRLKNRVAGSTAMIGLLDQQHLATGGSERQRGAMIYVHTFSSRSVRVSVTDGNAGGGELVQRSIFIDNASVPDVLTVAFTVDGSASPASCATSTADVTTAEGCMTLEVKDFGTITDSYGTLTTNDSGQEFANGAVVGWEAHLANGTINPSTGIGVGYRLDVRQATT